MLQLWIYAEVSIFYDMQTFPFCNFYYTFKGSGLEGRALCIYPVVYISGNRQDCFTKGAEPVWQSPGNRAQRLNQKDSVQHGVRSALVCCSPFTAFSFISTSMDPCEFMHQRYFHNFSYSFFFFISYAVGSVIHWTVCVFWNKWMGVTHTHIFPS